MRCFSLICRLTACQLGTYYVNKPSLSPLSESVLLILLSLAKQPRHGYAILKDVEEMSRKRVVLSTGTL